MFQLITLAYVAVCIGIWVYINFIAQGDKYQTAMRLGALYPPRIERKKEYWRMITCNFIHVDIMHLFMNCYCIYFLGSAYEGMMGPLYIVFLLFVMIFSSFVTYYVAVIYNRGYETLTIGASGVFYGYLGAMIALGLLVGGNFLAILQSNIYIIAINLLFTMMNPRISKTGHLGGLIGGYLFIYILYLLGFLS